MGKNPGLTALKSGDMKERMDMRNVILYVTVSEDGFLADEQGGVDWILPPEEEEDILSPYEAFYAGVDTIFMGRVTYEQISQEISPEIWMYGGKQTYVFTQTAQDSLPDIRFTQRSPQELLRYLKHRRGADIWLCGGATLITAMMEGDLIDEYRIHQIPVTLGKGISMPFWEERKKSLALQSTTQVGGVKTEIFVKEQAGGA